MTSHKGYKIVSKDPLRGSKRFKLLLSSAKNRNISVNMNYNQYRKIISGNCFYCGTSLQNETGYSIDRFNNNLKEYSVENSLGCCWDCNRAKGKKSHQDFYKWMNKLLNHQKHLTVVETNMQERGEICNTTKGLMEITNSIKNTEVVDDFIPIADEHLDIFKQLGFFPTREYTIMLQKHRDKQGTSKYNLG